MIQEEILKQIKPGAKIKVFTLGISTKASKPGGSKKDKSAGDSAKAEGTTSIFEGLVIAKKHGQELGGTFTVRRIIGGVGVEKVFPINSPAISKVQIVSSPKKVHRSKLYFVREVSGKTLRRKLGVSI